MAGVAMVAAGARDPCWRWGLTAVSFGFHRGLRALLARRSDTVPLLLPDRWYSSNRKTFLMTLYLIALKFPPHHVFWKNQDWTLLKEVCRQKTSVSFLSRPDLPNLAYKRLKGKSPGIIFIPGYISNMNGTKAMAIEEFCKSLGHAYIRFDYSGVGNSDGNLEECTVGRWRKDVLSIIDDLAVGPQILVGSSLGGWLMLHAAIARPQKVVALIGVAAAVDGLVTKFNQLPVEVKKEIEMKGVWSMPSKYSEDGAYRIQYSCIKEAEHHCLLHSPIPVNCPIRLLHGMKDDIVPWHTSIQVADRVVSTDVDVILRKHSDHRMKEKADIQLLVYTIDDLIDKLSTVVN
ncbi:palmitoyl-protein thioesterase ABHD10, mitochondrial isoform X1 [Pteronotus mesoamericanus]|uniref:palmitoyl-protein thioesterase ABHD10, mitochondrial isoform X1 n=1 Tax=Pteronotus mesoamericanus TaxID=1884717 RepID=UPI0023EC028E|nr:palmitoyl-protein thioesterase ABHD10, mitochondrial isoform X1 [Pteronotus parnellii mesoamericanus]